MGTVIEHEGLILIDWEDDPRHRNYRKIEEALSAIWDNTPINPITDNVSLRKIEFNSRAQQPMTDEELRREMIGESVDKQVRYSFEATLDWGRSE